MEDQLYTLLVRNKILSRTSRESNSLLSQKSSSFPLDENFKLTPLLFIQGKNTTPKDFFLLVL